MMGVNQVHLVGRITQPNIIQFTTDDKVTGEKVEFSLVTRERFLKDGKAQFRDCWHRVSIYTRRQVERLIRLGIDKGDIVQLTGHIEYYSDESDPKSQKATIAVSDGDLLEVYAAKKRPTFEAEQAAAGAEVAPEAAHQGAHDAEPAAAEQTNEKDQ
jgi:single-stranded DNA-binding protein